MAEYTIIIEHDPVTGLYCGQCQQLPEAISQGHTEEELMNNIREAIELVLEDRAENIKRLYSGHRYTSRNIAINA
jgi:predicted RNase H-like HicB family nuclease